MRFFLIALFAVCISANAAAESIKVVTWNAKEVFKPQDKAAEHPTTRPPFFRRLPAAARTREPAS